MNGKTDNKNRKKILMLDPVIADVALRLIREGKLV